MNKKEKMIRYIFITTVLLILSIQSPAQSVSLDFPYFAGQEYHFWAFRGEKQDTIASGRLDEHGRGKLTLPDRMKGHRGMTQWMLVNGGGLDIIFAGEENFSVSCPEAQPSEENITYTGSRENMYLPARFRRQQDILGKADAMRAATEAYKDNTELLSFFNTELQKQAKAYNLLQEETAGDGLYAARFAQIVDISRGLPPVFTTGQQPADSLMKDFILNKLDMETLYTSGHWENVLQLFTDWYIYDEKSQGQFIPDVIRLLTRTQSAEAYAALAEKVIVSCERQNWHDQEIELAFFLLNDNRIKQPEGKTASLYTLLKVRKGGKAPALAQGVLPAAKTILAFYDSGCGTCTGQMGRLAEMYPQLKEQGYEVISLSSDSDKGAFDAYAEKLPWENKYCDPEGYAGKDFRNYGIIGTPTFYLLDAEGIIQGRYAQVEDMDIFGADK
jgi:hypothetical protein